MSFINEIKSRYKYGNIVEKIIFINLGCFILTLLVSVVQGLYKSDTNWIFSWFSLDYNYYSLISKPWTLVTYGFLHADFVHILLNLFVFYYIGNLFIEYFTQKQLLNFYIFGTIFGGFFYILSQNYFPLFEGQTSFLVGSSAGVSAIFVGIATYIPDYQIKIRFLGFVKIWYLVAIWVGLDILGLAGANSGGHFAHIGGALFGFLYVKQASNIELNFWGNLLKKFSFKKKPLKTVYKSKQKKPDYQKTSLTQQQIDAILDKISKSGYNALTKKEKEFLFKQGKK